MIKLKEIFWLALFVLPFIAGVELWCYSITRKEALDYAMDQLFKNVETSNTLIRNIGEFLITLWILLVKVFFICLLIFVYVIPGWTKAIDRLVFGKSKDD